MPKPPLLSIIVLSSDRLDLLQTTTLSLISRMTYPHWELIIYNHQGSHEEGLIKLINQASGEYLFNCEDDWVFIEKGDWVQGAIAILDEHPEVGMIKLRKDGDGQRCFGILETINYGFITADDEYSNNPFIARTADIKKVLAGVEKPMELYIEKKMLASFKKTGLKIAKLSGCYNRGVCTHIGWGRQVGKRKWS